MKRKSLDVVETNEDGSQRAHVTLKAVVTTTDQGVFEAVISTESVDREKDIVSAPAMVDALRKWNRPIPLAWNHSTDAADIFGHIDPETVKAVDGEVVAGGQVDLASDVGREAWRSFKSRSIGFSFGYLITASSKRKGGGRHITGLDVFEVTATPTPMNNDTRVLSTKGTEELRKDSQRLEREVAESTLPKIEVPAEPVQTELEKCEERFAKELQEIKAQLAKVSAGRGQSAEELREDSKQLEREVEELKIPVIPEQPKAPAEPEIDLAKELQEVKARLATSEQLLEDLKKKAEVTDKETPGSRSVDPLRKRSEELALEVSSGGMSLRKPPEVAETKAEPVDVDELKRQSRDFMFEVLSYSTE